MDLGKKNRTGVPPRPDALELPPLPWRKSAESYTGPWAETHPCGMDRKQGAWTSPFIENPKKSVIIIEHSVSNIVKV